MAESSSSWVSRSPSSSAADSAPHQILVRPAAPFVDNRLEVRTCFLGGVLDATSLTAGEERVGAESRRIGPLLASVHVAGPDAGISAMIVTGSGSASAAT